MSIDITLYNLSTSIKDKKKISAYCLNLILASAVSSIMSNEKGYFPDFSTGRIPSFIMSVSHSSDCNNGILQDISEKIRPLIMLICVVNRITVISRIVFASKKNEKINWAN